LRKEEKKVQKACAALRGKREKKKNRATSLENATNTQGKESERAAGKKKP